MHLFLPMQRQEPIDELLEEPEEYNDQESEVITGFSNKPI